MQTLESKLFTTPIERAFMRGYRRLFSLHELEGSTVLQWVFGATLLSYFLAFSAWINSTATTLDAVRRGAHACWPHFQSCGEWIFLEALPNGYSQTFLYMALFGLLVAIVYLISRKDWALAHMVLLPVFLWHAWVSFFLTYALTGNYDYYLFFFAAAVLFLPHKEFFLKAILVSFYFLSTAAKIHETWILGTYFSSLTTGLPLFPDSAIPFLTNFVIFMEMVAAWFLMSRTMVLQRIVLVFFVIFHLYSGLLVEYRYPATVLPTLLILFGPWYRFTPPPFDYRAIAGWSVLAAMFFAQMVPLMIPGDEKLTLEGNKIGLYMFEANHQCVSTATILFTDATAREFRDESISARARCDAYRYWFRLKNICSMHDDRVASIAWTFDHSVNGGPFLRIVDTRDACKLSYQAFTHNAWIRTEKDNPPIVGYPLENIYE